MLRSAGNLVKYLIHGVFQRSEVLACSNAPKCGKPSKIFDPRRVSMLRKSYEALRIIVEAHARFPLRVFALVLPSWEI